MKKTAKTLSLVLAALILLTSCGSGGYKTMENATFGDIRTEYNQSLDLSAPTFTKNEVPSDYEAVYEAEDGVLTGACSVKTNSAFSGGKGVTGINDQNSTFTVTADIEYSGFYDIIYVSYTDNAGRANKAVVDGQNIGEMKSTVSNQLEDVTMSCVYLDKGAHEIGVASSWGWIDYDCVKLVPSAVNTEDYYKVTTGLSNPNADERTKRLYNFLCDIYGQYTLTGQYCDGRTSNEYKAILDVTGKEFAVLGMDVDTSLCAVQNGSTTNRFEFAYDWYVNKGGIVQYCWHWHSPMEYVPAGKNWYSSFYTESSNINLDKAMNGEDDILLQLLIDDIDYMSEQLARLRDCGVPVIWRPLHEGNGGWFWWGAYSPESYVKLWRLMYDRMTNVHGLTNLIWMWNCDDPAWYPGDDVVDIVSSDIYAGEHEYASQTATFLKTSDCTGERKLTALSECGCIPDPDLMQRDNTRWLLYGVWGGDYCIKWGDDVYNTQYTEKEMLKKVYDSEYTLTLDELPDLKNYRLD